MANLIGQENFSNLQENTQVYNATHDGAGNSLSHMNKSFISFSFGGENIEDFGLLVTIDDRLKRGAYSSFSDLTSSFDTLDGQLYWGSKIEPNKLDLTLSTDGITERQLDRFREWFAPGKIRELILSEHPNRAIMARVATAPEIALLPFQQQVKAKIVADEESVLTSTTLYKGDISLSFIMDESFWYSKLNYMPIYVNKKTLSPLQYEDENDDKVESLYDADMIKIMYEDRIPYQAALEGFGNSTFFLGGNLLVKEKAIIGLAQINSTHLGIVTEETEGLIINPSTPQYLFYSGTTKSYPTINFSINPTFEEEDENNNKIGYITCIKNKYINSNKKSYIQIGENKMEFTTPSIITSYNQIIYMFKNSLNISKVELLEQIKFGVNDYYARAWGIACVNQVRNTTINADDRTNLIKNMSTFLENGIPFNFIINSKTGEAIGTFSVRMLNAGSNFENASYYTVKENVGDMICSDYLVIEGRDYLNSDGGITEENCHKILSNENLLNVLVLFKNMYL